MHGVSSWVRASTLVRLCLAATLVLTLTAPRVHAAPIRIMALGDSLTAGFGLPHEQGFVAVLQDAIDDEHLGAHVLDDGVSGDTSADALARLDWALGDHPDAAIVEIGGNDGLRGLPPGQMQRNIAAILDGLRAHQIPTLLSGMVAPPNMGKRYGQAFAAVFAQLSKRRGLIYDPFFLQGVPPHAALEQSDHIHPNAAGVRLIVSRLMPDVRKLIADARSHADRSEKVGANGAQAR